MNNGYLISLGFFAETSSAVASALPEADYVRDEPAPFHAWLEANQISKERGKRKEKKHSSDPSYKTESTKMTCWNGLPYTARLASARAIPIGGKVSPPRPAALT